MQIGKQRDAYRRRVEDALLEVCRLKGYLRGPKFQGQHPEDGSPNQWVSSEEMLRHLDNVKDLLEGWQPEEGVFDEI